MPDLVKHFYFTKEEVISELKLHYFPGGETKALDVLKLYLSSNRISKHGRMRGNTFQAEFTSKLSPYLASGCLSVRKVFFDVEKWEKDT